MTTTTGSTTDATTVRSEKCSLHFKYKLLSHKLSQYLDNGIDVYALIAPCETTMSN